MTFQSTLLLWSLLLFCFLPICECEHFYNNSIVRYVDERLRLHRYARLTTPELIKHRGYSVEVHNLTTKDGYLLEIHRIPFGRKGNSSRSANSTVTRIPVLLEHGGAQSSIDWLLNEDVNNCLGFILADAGYDVWLGNFRGNPYSDKHVKYTLSDPEYWDYTPEEIGVYDITTMIDYILAITGQPKLHFIGFSMGTTAFYMGMSEKPEYNDKIRLGTSIGVAAFQHHSTDLQFTCQFLEPAFEVVRLVLGNFAVPNHMISRLINTFIPHVCNRRTVPVIPDICYIIWSLSWGYDGEQIPRDELSLLLSKLPTSSSSKSFIHICQNVNHERFGKFNYGKEQNLELYKNEIPPAYNLSKITCPMMLFSAPRDGVCVYEDIKLLAEQLPNVVDLYRVPLKTFNHVDFTYGKDANRLVYRRILKFMKKY